jgi:hypothetical protein
LRSIISQEHSIFGPAFFGGPFFFGDKLMAFGQGPALLQKVSVPAPLKNVLMANDGFISGGIL